MIRIGLIGLDSTHALEFTRAFSAGISDARSPVRVVAACAGLGTDFPLSVNRRDRIRRELVQALKIPLTSSVLELTGMVDAFMILSCDGRCHRREIFEVISTRKPIFIDKPLSADWRDAIAILQAARLAGSPCFSASALRYRTGPVGLRIPPADRPVHLEIVVPRRQEPGHPDLLWHGIHGIESAFGLLGAGCLSVQRDFSAGNDATTGSWRDGSTACIRRVDDESARSFPIRIRSATGEWSYDDFDYAGLLQIMADFFHSGTPPLSDREMVEPLGFAAAADASRDQGGALINLPDFLAQGPIECEPLSRSR